MISAALNSLSYDRAIRVVHTLYKTLHMAKTGERYDYMKDDYLSEEDRKIMQRITGKIKLSRGNGAIDLAIRELNHFTDKLLEQSGADVKRGQELLAHWK